MASLFTHALVGTALGQAASREWRKNWRFWCLVVSCSVLPDVDSIGFHMGIPYGTFWGHRGITHSLAFAALVAVSLAAGFSSIFRRPWALAGLLFVVTVSHGILDAMTDGGLGIAFFSPFNLQRYFLPWRPIHVSPIAVGRFFSTRGTHILWNEILWVWFPTLAICGMARAAQSLRRLLGKPIEAPAIPEQ